MARLRFPGRPGCRFGRLGVRYGADEAGSFHDPVLTWVANIHRGLRQFRELCGESDEDEEFSGFTADDVKKAESRLRKHEASMDGEKEEDVVSPDTSFSPSSGISTRFSKQKENLENLPASERTRNREKTVIRRSYRDLLTKGISKPSKSYFIKSRKDVDTPQIETKKALASYYKRAKAVSPGGEQYYEQVFKIKLSGKFKGARVIHGKGRPKYLKTVVRNLYGVDIPEGSQHHSSPEHYVKSSKGRRKERDKRFPVVSTVLKRDSKNIAKSLLNKAKKGKDDHLSKKKLPVKKKQFVLPTQSSRSSRVIIPNKRFIEDDTSEVAKKRRESDLNIFDTSPSFRQPFSTPLSQNKMDKLHIQTEFPVSTGFGSFSPSVYKKASLFDQPLITEGKRERRPSHKLKLKTGQVEGYVDNESNDFNETRKVHIMPSKLGQSMHSPPLVSPIIAPPKFGSTPFKSLTQQTNDVEATKRSGHHILRKAKLQLNRAAVNRSKVALAKSLRKEMKREERNKKKVDESSLGYSTYTGRSRHYMDEGPENQPIDRADFDHCKVCGHDKHSGRLLRRVICISCYKCYKRNTSYAHVPCMNNDTCDIINPNKSMCRPCKYRKSSKVYLSAVEKSETKSPLKSVLAKNKSPANIQHEKKKQEIKTPHRKLEGKQHDRVPAMPLPEVMETDDHSPPPSPTPVEVAERSDVTTSPESHTSPQSSVRGPRIKHVCRKAAVVLGKTVARFPQHELTLSALPKGEKKRILKQDELDKAAYSDDEKTIEEIIQDAEEGVDTYVKSPPTKILPKMKTQKTPSTFLKKTSQSTFLKTIKAKRKLRCKKCAGCLAEDCGSCNFCLDKPKFGGRGVMKQACVERKCHNPHYTKAATALTLQLKEGYTTNPHGSSDVDSEMNNNDSAASNSSKSCLNVLRRFGQKTNVVKTSSNQQLDQHKDNKTPATISRQLQFGANSIGENHQLTNVSKISSRTEKAGRIATKVPSAVATRNEPSRQTRGTSQLWKRLKPQDQAQHRLKADFKEVFNVWTAWQFGVSLTVGVPLCCRTVCFLCGSAGKHEFYYCNVCCEPFHEFCLEDDEKPASDNLENWVCRQCQFCTVCGQQKNLLKCDKCQNTYHPECLGPNYPTKPSKKKNIWICTKCVKCKSCGATTPGTTSNATWTHDFQLCYVCGQLMDKGNFCPICHKCYSDDDWDCKMVQCAKCDSWVHAKCEGLSDEMYERVSCLPEDVHYICRMCAGHRTRHWELVLKDDFIAGIKSIFYSIFNAKCSKFLAIDSKKHLSDSNIVMDESSNDSVSSKGSKCSRSSGVSSAINTEEPSKLSTSAIVSTQEPGKCIVSSAVDTDKPLCSASSAVNTDGPQCIASSAVNTQTPQCMAINMQKCVELSTNPTCDKPQSNTSAICEVTRNGSNEINSEMNQIVPMETDEKGENCLLNCDSKVVNVCDKNVTSNPLDEPDGNKSYVLKSTQDVELFIKNLEGIVQRRMSAESSSVINTLPSIDQSLSLPKIDNNQQKSLQFSSDSNSSSAQSEVTNKTPEKKGAIVRFAEHIPPIVPSHNYPKDLMTVRQKIIAGDYDTVEQFSEDIAYIIETALTDTEEQGVVRKKAINSVRSIFVKQMEKCFPWYNVKACRMWEHNRLLPQNMLPQAVIPPFDDHTYAQWLEREDIPRSPQPSPFKKVIDTPIKKLFPVVDPDEEGEKVLSSDLADDGQDTRRCILCWHYGDADPNLAGRLLYCGQDDWVHVNCGLWSAEVYEEGNDGALKNVHEAVSRGRKMKCDLCQRTGATVGCCTRGCQANFHFMCARRDGCWFQEDKKMFCSQHRDKVDHQLVSKDKFSVLRRVCVDREGMKLLKKTWNKGLTMAEINILIGSCTIESLGNLTALSDCKGLLLPVGFSCTRVYWSTKDSRRRCVYTCKITEYRPEIPKTPEATIKDMTIIHDITHPDYVPLSSLDLPMNLKRANIVDLTEDSIQSSDASRTLTASLDRTRMGSTDFDDSLSSSWPGTSKKRRSDPVSLDLSLLSPTTLRLLNKDPEKYRRTSGDTPTSKPANKSLPPVLPPLDEFPLAQIADRLNQAAAKSRQKSEERMVVTTVKVPSRPSSAPLFSRSRSNSAERLISPPRLCSSPKHENLSPVKESSDVIHIDDDIATDKVIPMETDGVAQDAGIDESLEPILNELSGEDENALIVITENGEELSDEDYAMILQLSMEGKNQLDSSASETSDSAIKISPNEVFKSGDEISVQEIPKTMQSGETDFENLAQPKCLTEKSTNEIQKPVKSAAVSDESMEEGDPSEKKLPTLPQDMSTVPSHKIDGNQVQESDAEVAQNNENSVNCGEHVETEKPDKGGLQSNVGTTTSDSIQNKDHYQCIPKEKPVDKEMDKPQNDVSTECPVLEKSIEEETTNQNDELTASMPVLTIESPMKEKINNGNTNITVKIQSYDEVMDKDKENLMEVDNSSTSKNSSALDEKAKLPENFSLRHSDSYILHEETGDFIPKPDSPKEKTPTTSPEFKSKQLPKKEKESSRSHELLQALDLTPTKKDEEEKEKVLKGLGLERTPSPRQERKSYPLRRRSSLKEEQVVVPLHDKLTQKIKAESMAKSIPGEEGPFKCTTCKRHYRTKESYQKHVSSCDFEVSSTTDDEEESETKSGPKRYPMRETTIVQSVVSQVEEQERKSSNKKSGKASLGLSPKVVLDRITPSKYSQATEKKLDDCDTSSTKRGRGRPPKNLVSPSAKSSPITPKTSKPCSTPSSAKRGRGRPPKIVSPKSVEKVDIEDQSEAQDTIPKSRGRPRLHGLVKTKHGSQFSKDRNHLRFRHKNTASSFAKKYFNIRDKHGKFLKIAKNDNPYAKQYLFSKNVNRYAYSKKKEVSRSQPCSKISQRRSSRTSDSSSQRSSVIGERRSSNVSIASKDDNFTTVESEDKDGLSETSDSHTTPSLKDKLSDLEHQVKRKRGRPRKKQRQNEKSDSSDKTSIAPEKDDQDRAIENETGDYESKSEFNLESVAQSTGRVSSDLSEFESKNISEDLLDKEIKQEVLDEEEMKEKKELRENEDSNKISKNDETLQDKVDDQAESPVKDENLDHASEKKDKEAVLGSADRPFVIDDNDDDPYESTKNSLAQAAQRRKRERTPRKSIEEEYTNVSLKSSPGVKALSEFLSQKEKTPPKSEPTTPVLINQQENFQPKNLFQLLPTNKDVQYTRESPTNTSLPRSRNSSGHSEERNIFQLLRKESPPKPDATLSSSYNAIKPATEYSKHSQPPSRGPPPLMTPSLIGAHNPMPPMIGAHNPSVSLIGTHNPSVSMTAFQHLQQTMPHVLQQIHQPNSAILPCPQPLPVNPPMIVSKPVQTAVPTFDIDQHINRMIQETSMAAGPVQQNQVLQQMVMKQTVSSKQLNAPSSSQLVSKPVTMKTVQPPAPPKAKLIPYQQLQAKLQEKIGNIPKTIDGLIQPTHTSAFQEKQQSKPNPVLPQPQQSSSGMVVPQQKMSSGAKPNTIVRIFVDGKPVALTTDPTVLQDHSSLLNKLGGGQIQSGTYSVTVSAHRVPSTNTSPTEANSHLPKVPAIQPILPYSHQSILPKPSMLKGQSVSPMNSSTSALMRPSVNSAIKDALDSRLTSRISSLSSNNPNQILSLLTEQPQLQRSLGMTTAQQNILSKMSSGEIPIDIQHLLKTVPLPERPVPSVSVQPKIMTSYVKKLDGTVQKKTIVKPMIVNRKRAAINPISITGSASKKPSMSTYLEKNGIVQGLLSKVYMRKLIKDGSPKPKNDIMQPVIKSGHHMEVKEKMVKRTIRKKTPRKSRNINKPHAGASASHPIIHGPKEATSLPQPALEEEVVESSWMSFMEHQQQVLEKAEMKGKNGAHLVFEITSDDGFSCKAETMEEAWKQVTEKVQDARTTARKKHLSCASVHGVNMFGVNHNAVIYLLEQLYGAQLCRNYKFRYHKYARTEEEEEPVENPTGSIRSEQYQTRKEFDIFSFLMSQYRNLPEMDLTDADNEMNLKSQRRATSMDLPMAMRFRKLKEHAREAVGVYRSYIHGRGLYCKRNIDAGEMIIEYSGEVIRASLTDKREKYYESKGIGCYMFRIDDADVVDATLHGSAARFINHSCEPNCYSKVIQVEGKKHIVIFAMRQIKKGEELTYDYKFPIEEVKIPCTCGSKKCRKYLN